MPREAKWGFNTGLSSPSNPRRYPLARVLSPPPSVGHAPSDRIPPSVCARVHGHAERGTPTARGERRIGDCATWPAIGEICDAEEGQTRVKPPLSSLSLLFFAPPDISCSASGFRLFPSFSLSRYFIFFFSSSSQPSMDSRASGIGDEQASNRLSWSFLGNPMELVCTADSLSNFNGPLEAFVRPRWNFFFFFFLFFFFFKRTRETRRFF